MRDNLALKTHRPAFIGKSLVPTYTKMATSPTIWFVIYSFENIPHEWFSTTQNLQIGQGFFIKSMYIRRII